MSATRLKVVPPQSGSDQPAPPSSEKTVAFGQQAASPFQVLSEAVHSYEMLQQRCEAAEDRNEREAKAHADVIGEARVIVTEKQKRIGYLETMLEECRAGLQSLAREAAQQAKILQKSEARCVDLTTLLAQKTDECGKLQQTALRLEQDAKSADTQHKLTMEFAARHSDYIKNMDLKIAAETRALQQSRDDLERFVGQTARVQRRPV